MQLEASAQEALDRARCAVAPGDALTAPLLIAALVHAPELQPRLPYLARACQPPRARRDAAPAVPFAESIRPLFEMWPPLDQPLPTAELLARLLETEAGRAHLLDLGLTGGEIDALVAALRPPGVRFRRQVDRRQLTAALARIAAALANRDDETGCELRERLRRLAAALGLTAAGSDHGDGDPDGGPRDDGTARRPAFDPLFDHEPAHDLHYLGNDLYLVERFEEAAECYSLALLLEPDLMESRFNRALAWARLTLYDRGLSDLDRLIEKHPQLSEAYYTRGLLHEYKLEFAAALRDYQRALELDPHYEKARKQMALARRKQQDEEDGTMRGGHDPDQVIDAERLARRRDARELREALERFHRHGGAGWRDSELRQRVLRFFVPRYADLLTSAELPDPELIGADDVIASVHRALLKLSRSSVILLGAAGTGKTAVVREIAHRIHQRRPPFQHGLADHDLIEIIPARVQADSKYLGTYEERLADLTAVLERCGNLIVFVDEIHSFFRASVTADHDLFTRGNQLFKRCLAAGEVTVIGCTTPEEYRHHMAHDAALARRFSLIHVAPPARDQTLRILRQRRDRIESHFAVRIPERTLERIPVLTDSYLPERNQPDKALQLLEEVAVHCATQDPPLAEAPPELPLQVLEQTTGAGGIRYGVRSATELAAGLREQVKGQDAVLTQISRAAAAALGDWLLPADRPRAVLLFAGPSGVGKSHTAHRLAELLGAGRDALLRIDCSTLPGQGWDSETILRRLLGAPPGSGSYVAGRGGCLSAIRDRPESVVLVDALEKADPTVGRLLLEIIDEGGITDLEGQQLDFRRAVVVITLRAGRGCGPHGIRGFRPPQDSTARRQLDLAALREGCRAQGLPAGFLARMDRIFLFQGLDRTAIVEIIERQFRELQRAAQERDLKLEYDPEVVRHLADRWEPHDGGVRQLLRTFRRRIIEPLNNVAATGGLGEVRVLHLQSRARCPGGGGQAPGAGLERRGDTLFIAAG